MKSMLVGVGMVVVATSLGLVSCGGDEAAANPTVIDIGATNFVTIPPTPVTAPPITEAPNLPGSIIEFESEYEIVEGDLPSTVAAKFHVDFQEFLTLNGWTLEGEGSSAYVPGWPTAGITIKIPPGATVPGEPVATAPSSTIAGDTSTGTESTQAPVETDPPATDPPESATTTTTSDCTPGSYEIAEGDYPGLVAEKFDVSVSALNAANANTKYYGSFIAGVKIVIPC
jgi:LysM repeat protein